MVYYTQEQQSALKNAILAYDKEIDNIDISGLSPREVISTYRLIFERTFAHLAHLPGLKDHLKLPDLAVG